MTGTFSQSGLSRFPSAPLPPVKPAQGRGNCKALMYHESMVTLQGPGVLQIVNVVGEHYYC